MVAAQLSLAQGKMLMYLSPTALICCSCLTLGYLVYMPGGQTMTSIDLYCTRPSGLVNLYQQGHLAFVPGDLAKASIVHIVPSDSMTSRAEVLACVQLPPP